MNNNFTQSLRLLSVIFFLAVSATNSFANDDKKPAATKAAAATTSFRFAVNKEVAQSQVIDSALIVLDKYDHTGAGVVVQMVKLDANNELTLTNISEGKYYAGIYTYGVKKEYVSVVITVKKNKAGVAKIKLAEAEAYVPGTAVIPAENTKLFSYIK
jgi:hypothetical protein